MNIEKITNMLVKDGNRQISINTYLNSYRRICREALKNENPSIEELSNTKKIMSYIYGDGIKMNNKFNLINGFLHIIKYIDGYPQNKLETIKKEFKELSQMKSKMMDYRDANETEKENHISFKEIIELRESKKKELENNYTLANHIQYVILCLYTFLPPLRNQDYSNTQLYYNCKKLKKKSPNYLCLTCKKLIITEYKTSVSHGKREIDIPNELLEILEDYKDKTETVYLLPSLTSINKKMSETNLSHVLNVILKKKVSSTMLRRIFISENISKWNADDRKKISNIMGHSVGQQVITYTIFNDDLHNNNNKIPLLEQIKKNINETDNLYYDLMKETDFKYC